MESVVDVAELFDTPLVVELQLPIDQSVTMPLYFSRTISSPDNLSEPMSEPSKPIVSFQNRIKSVSKIIPR